MSEPSMIQSWSLSADEAVPVHVRHDAEAACVPEGYDAIRLERLRQAVGASSISQVAARIGISRTALSLVLSGKYPGRPHRILERYERWANGVDCPHLRQRIPSPDCHGYATRSRPGSPLGLQHYRACQQCPVGHAMRRRGGGV